jgi:hypothetical protein
MLFNYMYSTAPRPPSPSAASTTPLAGYGYGLPLSRLYAKYFNGDLNLSSVEGYGTDAIIYMRVFPNEANELLPIYNKTSYHKYSSSVPIADWSDPSQTTGLHGAFHKVGQHRMFTSRASKNTARTTPTTTGARSYSTASIAANSVLFQPLISKIYPRKDSQRAAHVIQAVPSC